MLQLILIVKLVTCEMHSKIKFFNQKPTNEIGRPHYTPLVVKEKIISNEHDSLVFFLQGG